MTKEPAYSSLRAEPFKPFSLRRSDGSVIPVPQREFMALSHGGRTAVVFTEGEKLSVVDVGLVTAIESGWPNRGELGRLRLVPS